MRIDHLSRSLFTMAILVVVSVVCASCGGGGGAGDSTSNNAAQAGSIFIPSVPQGSNFVIAGTQNEIPTGVFLNARLRFVFAGAVSPGSLPAAGLAIGNGIDIVNTATNVPASGAFSMGPGVGEIFFDAFPPSSTQPGQGCQAGFQPNAEYVIDVKSVGVGGPGVSNILVVNGSPLSTGISGKFQTISCDAMSPNDSFDPSGATPVVMAVSPPAGFVGPAGAIPGSNSNSTVLTVDLDAAVDPSSANAGNLVLVNRTINATTSVPVGGTVALQQLGSVPGNPLVARITYTTSSPLAGGFDYELLFQGVTGLAGGMIAAPATGTTFTVTGGVPLNPPPFVEDFTTTTNRGSLTQSIEWPGNGTLSAILPIAILGTGLDGVGNFNTSITINADNNTLPGGGMSTDPNARPGEYNFTSLTFGTAAGAVRNFVFSSQTDVSPGEANFPVHFRSQTTIQIFDNASLNFDGRQQTMQGGGGVTPALAIATSIPGGWGGPGGGRGGTSSPINDATVINLSGLPGEGAHTSLTDNTKSGGVIGNVGSQVVSPPTGLVDPFYGGGEAGRAGISVAAAPNLGPSGGGGGTSSSFAGYPGGMHSSGSFTIAFTPSTPGETQSGDGSGAGAPLAGVAGQPMTAMMTPLTFAVGGSGGGSSGDRGTQLSGPASYRSGGAGGGAGGGARFSAGGDISIGIGAMLTARGGQGGSAIGFAVSHGGGGSGGSILVQTFGQINLGIGVTLDTAGGQPGMKNPPDASEPALNGEGGRGGDGVIQLEDVDGIPDADVQFAIVNGELLQTPFPLAGTITDMAQSVAIDTNSNGTTYQSASSVSSPGNDPASTVVVQFYGIAENPAAPNTPATTVLSSGGAQLIVGPFTAAQVAQMNGYRYFMFEVVTSYLSSATASPTPVILPSVSSITINFNN